MQQTRTQIKRMIEKARVGGYLSTLAYYVYIEVPPHLRIEGVKGGPYHKPQSMVPVIPLLGSFQRVFNYDLSLMREMEEWSDVLVLTAMWKWQGTGIIFYKNLTALSVLEETKTNYYNVLDHTCDVVCPHCGAVSRNFTYLFKEGEGCLCTNCTPHAYRYTYKHA